MLSLDRKIVYDIYGKMIWKMRLLPSHATRWMAGLFLPPHERFWFTIYFAEYKENNVLASRGTSKTALHGSFAPVIYAVLFKHAAQLTLSNSGFRGGKLMLMDSERMVNGQLRSQKLPGLFLKRSLEDGKTLKKDPSMWSMNIRKSTSANRTAPTNNPEQLRGIRTTKAGLDERGFMDEYLPKAVIRPMLNVGSDFENTATASDKNQLHQYSTIDMTVRPWWGELEAARTLALREYLAQQARKQGDWDEYDRLMREDNNRLDTASFSFSRFDYTDLIIPTIVNTIDGQHRYEVHYPVDPGMRIEQVTKFDRTEQRELIYTYPVDKDGIEEPLRQGTVDTEIFAAENRNVPIAAYGNVFSVDLITKASERPVWKPSKKQTDDGMEGYYAPLLYTCGDPCVLGVDVARESDETTFVIMRLGELASGDFKPFEHKLDKQGRTLLGNTSWNHFCWAEAHPKLQADKAAALIRDFYKRYNIVYATSSSGDYIPGIAMDKRGGGGAVRDALGNPKPDVVDGVVEEDFVWDEVVKIYDPEDDTFSHYTFKEADDSKHYAGALRLVATTNNDNFDWTMGMRAMMQQGKLMLAYWMPPSKWAAELGLILPNGDPDRINPEYQKWEVGYIGMQRLKFQLLRIQKKVTEQGVVRFVMPGNRQKDEGKKDLWAGSIYCYSVARAHLQGEVKEETELETVEPIMFNMTDRIYANSDW